MTAPAAPLEKAVENGRAALAKHDARVACGPGESALADALQYVLDAIDDDRKPCEPGVTCPTCVALEKAEEALRKARVTANDHARDVIDRYFIIKATTQWLPSGSDMADRFGGSE